MTIPQKVKVTAAKAWVAGIGGTLTALTTGLAAVQLAVEDGSLGVDEVGSVTGALVLMAVTVYGVWRAPRYDVDAPYVPAAEDRVQGPGL